MGLRDWVNEHPSAALIAAVAILLLSLGWLLTRTSSSYRPRSSGYFFYDLGTGELFVAQAAIPPIDTKSGEGQGVRAVVFSCGKCQDKSTRFIGWLERYTPEARALMLKPPAPNDGGPDAADHVTWRIDAGHQLAAPPEPGADPRWVPLTSHEGTALMQSVRTRCPGAGRDNQPEVCSP